MSEHLSDATLQRHVDGDLSPAERWEVERHLCACPSCDRQRDGLLEQIAGTSELPESIQPPSDLWPEIEARLGGTQLAERTEISRRFMRRETVGIVAAVLAAAAMLALGIGLGRQLPEPPPTNAMGSTEAPLSEAVLASYDESGFQNAIADLERLLAERQDQLQPETVATVEENLAIIDQAIAESRAAILADPANERLHRHLTRNMQMKTTLLRMVTGVASVEI